VHGAARRAKVPAMKKRVPAILAACAGALVVSACGDHDHDRYRPPAVDPCSSYSSCGTCTPVLGCGWCFVSSGSSLDVTGECSSTPCSPGYAGATGWTWDPSGCLVVAQPTVGSDAGADSSSPGDASLPTEAGPLDARSDVRLP